MSRRKPLPHEDVVKAIREHVSSAVSLARRTISDDMDQWYVGRGEDSPINSLVSSGSFRDRSEWNAVSCCMPLSSASSSLVAADTFSLFRPQI